MGRARDPILEDFCAHAPRLLRVECSLLKLRLASRPLFEEIVLSFHGGVLRVSPAQDANELRCSLDASPSDADRVDSSEEEPWWRVMGAPLVAAWARLSSSPEAPEITLQFRSDSANPRFISLIRARTGMDVRWENREALEKRLAQTTEQDPRE